MTPKQVVEFAKENGALMVDFKFMDFVGIWQHFTQPISEFGEETFEEGIGFDGSSIRGWQPINASDMLIVPDATTAQMDPFMAQPTLTLSTVPTLIGNQIAPRHVDMPPAEESGARVE